MAEIGTDIEKAKDLIHGGELVAIPTETVYGLAANALNLDSIASIFSVKNRPSFDPLIVHLKDIEDVEKYALNWTDKAFQLATAFWPGPLTILLNKRTVIPDLVTSGMEKVALRVPNQELTLGLLNTLDTPLVAPSANPFGYVSPTNPMHVNDQLGDKVPYILDGGVCKIGLESTIVGFDDEGEPTVYRLGGLSVENIESVIGPVEVTQYSSSNPQAPGMLKSHYSPQVSVRFGDIEKLSDEFDQIDKVGAILFSQTTDRVHLKNQIVLAADGKMETAAKNLFSALRQMDTLGLKVLLVEEVPCHGLGKAINDRLRRAAAK